MDLIICLVSTLKLVAYSTDGYNITSSSFRFCCLGELFLGFFYDVFLEFPFEESRFCAG